MAGDIGQIAPPEARKGIEYRVKTVNCSVCGLPLFTIEYDHPSLFDGSKTYKHEECVKKKKAEVSK